MGLLKPTALALSLAVLGFGSAAHALQPKVAPEVTQAANAINADSKMQALLKEAVSDEAAKWRFNQHMELTRIASPSREEWNRAREIKRRLIEEWGFSPEDIVTQDDGYLKGAGVQIVDGKPVCNLCIRIPGTYGARPDAKSYKGQFPKVLIEGHLDVVNPATLEGAESPYLPIKLQPMKDPIVATPEELAAIKLELHFDKNGKIIEDDNYKLAYRRFNTKEEALKNGGYRIYVPGYGDAMVNTTAVFHAAVLMKKYKIQPVYDIWICGTAGEEGEGNLAGMKQLYGYSQEAGKGNNALNFVANYGLDCTGPDDYVTNFLGSYRFEVSYHEPAGWKLGDKKPSATSALSRAIAAIADIHSPYDFDKKAERTTYTVGTATCDKPKEGRSTKCTLMVDMRSPTNGPLMEIRKQIEPQFKKALEAENSAYGLKDGDKDAVTMTIDWFGDRPAYQRPNFDDIVMQSWWVGSRVANIDIPHDINIAPASMNDNVPAALGVPTLNFNLGTVTDDGGTHAFYEYGAPGSAQDEGRRLYRVVLMSLIAAGYETSDGKTIEPNVGPIGNRTTEEMFK